MLLAGYADFNNKYAAEKADRSWQTPLSLITTLLLLLLLHVSHTRQSSKLKPKPSELHI
jgi:hypothetical protein